MDIPEKQKIGPSRRTSRKNPNGIKSGSTND
jgi:hypothetical protein